MLIIAGHVITGRMSIREEDYQNENVRILARTKNGAVNEYKIVLCGITINWPNGPLKEPLQIDLAILRPVQPLINVPFLEIEEKKQEVGAEVPSGSALALSPYTIIDFLNHQIQNQQKKAAI